MPPERYYVWHPPDCDTFAWFLCDTQLLHGQKAIARFREENRARWVAHRLNRQAMEAGGGSVPLDVTKLFGEAAKAIAAARRLISKNYLPASTGSAAHLATLGGLESLLKILSRVLREDLKSETERTTPRSEDDDAEIEEQ